MEKEIKDSGFELEGQDGFGRVRIANDVVARIACLAAMEVKGVYSLAEAMTSELLQRVGVKTVSKGAKVEISEGVVCVDMSLVLVYGYNIPDTCEKVQGRVRAQIETMTGLRVKKVNVRVCGIAGEK